MKKIYLILLIFVALGTFSSCDDTWLEVDSKTLLSDEDIAENPELAEAQFLSLYQELRENVNSIGEGRMAGSAGNHLDAYTDDGTCAQPWWSGISEFNSPGKMFGKIRTASDWVWPYRTINKLNKFIEKFKDSENEGVLGTVGEAYCLRAWLYFEMVKRYGGVPLHTENIDELSAITDRKSEAESWDFILAEFDNAIALLPDAQKIQSENKDRVNKFTALALKARAGLYAGTLAKYGTGELNNGLQGISSTKAKNYLEQGAEAAKRFVDENNGYALDPTFGDLFNGKNENSDEIIFRFQNNAKSGIIVYIDYWTLSYKIKKKGYTAFMNPYIDVVEQFEKLDGTIAPLDYNAQYTDPADFFAGRDKRLAQTIIYPGGEFQGEKFDIYREVRIKKADGTVETHKYNTGTDWNNRGVVPNYPQYTKSGIDGIYKNDGAHGTTIYGFFLKKTLFANKLDKPDDFGANLQEQDAVVIRYGEVLLTLAELAAELNELGNSTYIAVGQDALNAVRNIHGGLPPKALTIETARHERRIDLMYEGFRYWDLKRWRMGTQMHQQQYHALHPILNIDESTTPASIYYTIEDGGVPDYLATRIKWFEEKDYYSPLPVEDNPGLTQNIGW